MYRGDTVSIYSISVQISHIVCEEKAHKFGDLHVRIILFILKIKIKNCLKEKSFHPARISFSKTSKKYYFKYVLYILLSRYI